MPISPTPDEDAPHALDPTSAKVLLLGETTEATELANALADRLGCHLMRTGDIAPAVLAQMASAEGLTGFLRAGNIRLILNAADPYDSDFHDRALAASVAADLPILRLTRPAWQRDPLDSWIDVKSVSAAADICRWYGKRTMITLGETDLAPFAGNDRCHFIVRMPVAPSAPPLLAHYDLIIDGGPFAWLDERRLMMEQKIDLVVSRNIGGHESYAKIDVARDLAIPVVMITRPAQPLQASVETTAQALTWIDAWQQAETDQAAERRLTGEQKATTAESE